MAKQRVLQNTSEIIRQKPHNMNNQHELYDATYRALESASNMCTGNVVVIIELSNDRGSFKFRLKDGKVTVKFTPLLKRTKKRRPGKRMSPKRKKLIVSKVIFTEWAPLNKKISSLRDLENYLIRYNKKLKKTNRL